MTSIRSVFKLLMISALVAVSLGAAFAEDENVEDIDAVTVEEIVTADVDLVIVDVVSDDLGEYVEIMNNGTEAVTFANWTLVVDGMDNYPLPEFTLQPEADVTVYTGEGDDTETEIYLDNDAPVLDEEGTVALVDDAGSVVVEFAYPQ